MIRSGDILFFKRNKKDIISGILNNLLKLLEPNYRRNLRKLPFEVWHSAPILRKISIHEVAIMEASHQGNYVKELEINYIKKNCVRFRIGNAPVSKDKIKKYVEMTRGTKYDFGAYLGTIVSYLMNRFFKKEWRFVDNEYHCWELTSLFASEVLDVNLQHPWEYPIIHKMLVSLMPFKLNLYRGNK